MPLWMCSATQGSIVPELNQKAPKFERFAPRSPCEKYIATASFDATVGVWCA